MDRRGRRGATALHLATMRKHLEVAELLLENGADTGIRDARGLTASEIAERAKIKSFVALYARYARKK